MTAAEAIYLLCAATSLMAAALLFRHHRARRTPLLFWTALAFFGLAISNVLLYVDLAVLIDVNLTPARTVVGAIAMVALLFGLIRGTRA